ncbi:MAG: recombinase family protein, partial [Solirubrobacteraceae bacterium]
ARVSSERQRQDETIQSQTVGLRELAADRGLLVAEDLIFEDEGFSGAMLQRPALERLRDRAAEGAFEVLLCHAPDRLARRYAYQVLLLDELARVGVEVCFAKEPERGGTPEDELLRQFQGMIAEYGKRRTTGMEKGMEESYVEDLASHGDPESCVGDPRGRSEALTGVRAGRPLSPEMRSTGVPTRSYSRKATPLTALFASRQRTPRGLRTRHVCDLFMLRTGRSHDHPLVVMEGRVARGRLRP